MANDSLGRTAFRRHALSLMTLLLTTLSQAAEFYLEAANTRGHQPRIMERSNARLGVSVRLGAGQNIELGFCLRQTTVMQVLGVRYSNDGLNETVAVVVDNQAFLGTFHSHNQTDWGRHWNIFLRSPVLPNTAVLRAGPHSLRLWVLLPSDEIELESVHIWFNDEGLTKAVVDCLLQCTTSLPAVPPNTARLWLQTSMRQASYPTQCAEEDNVKVPLYRGGISGYTITASMPTYVSFANHREPNTTNCAFLSPVLFAFTDLSLSNNQTFSLSTKQATLRGVRSPNTGKQTIQIDFVLQGRSKGHVDAEIGSILTVRVRKPSAQVLVKAAYSGRAGRLESLKNSILYPASPQLKLYFPDFTWRENGTNHVVLEFYSRDPVHVTKIAMERRPMRGETVRTVYDSANVVVEAIEVDFWWRRPETMKLINGETGQTWNRVDFFRISLRVPWNGGYAQVMVMYQDGNVRLAPLPPPSVDWIPFGSSVIVGYSDPSVLRPSAPVTAVTFHPSTLDLQVRYGDGGSARLGLVASRTLTQLTVRDIFSDERRAWTLPFATLRSMYIEDGNSDCDSVLVNGKSYHPIMDNWGLMKGKSFLFFRRCESKHLTLSPDIRIDVKTIYGGTARNGQAPSNWWWLLHSPVKSQASNNPYIN